MATNYDSAFSALGNISDDTEFVHQAMEQLGFVGDFVDLPISDMSLILALAQHLKLQGQRREIWES